MRMHSRVGLMAASALASSALVASLSYARFDGPGDPTIGEVAKEIKSFGDNFKGLKDSIEKDVKDIRSQIEGFKSGDFRDALVKDTVEKATISIATKQEALDNGVKTLNEQMEKLETAFKRSPTGPGNSDEEKKSLERAMKYFETKQAVSGNVSMASMPTVESIKGEMEAYLAWEGKEFGRYLRLNDERGVEEKALQVGSNPDGGYLVPTARSARIIQKIWESSPLRQLATIETIGTSELEIPVDIDEASAGWVGETQARPTTNTPQVGVQKIPVHEMYAKPRATQKFLEDASINVEQWLADKVADKFGRIEASAFISGDGINKPRGLFTYTPTATPGSVARGTPLKVISGGASTITPNAIVSIPFALKSFYLPGSSWLMKRSTVAAIMILRDESGGAGTGQYLWRPSLTLGAPSILGSYEVHMADDVPAVGAGNFAAAFGNWARAYTIVDRLGITTLRDPYSAKPFVEFYTRKRVGGDVVDFDAYLLMEIAAS